MKGEQPAAAKHEHQPWEHLIDFFFQEQAGELLVIVLSVWEKYDLVYEGNQTQKSYTWSQTIFNAHPKYTTSTRLAQLPANKAHDRDTGHQNRVTTEATTRSKP
jgi:hypothetical protein